MYGENLDFAQKSFKASIDSRKVRQNSNFYKKGSITASFVFYPPSLIAIQI